MLKMAVEDEVKQQVKVEDLLCVGDVSMAVVQLVSHQGTGRFEVWSRSLKPTKHLLELYYGTLPHQRPSSAVKCELTNLLPADPVLQVLRSENLLTMRNWEQQIEMMNYFECSCAK